MEGGDDYNSKYKTSLCNNFSKFGSCNFGERCKFAHGENELRPGGGGGGMQGGMGGFQGGMGGMQGGMGGMQGGMGGGYQGGDGMRGGYGGGGGMRGGYGGRGGFGGDRGGGMYNHRQNNFSGEGGNQQSQNICRFFQQNGTCNYGDNCRFQHEASN